MTVEIRIEGVDELVKRLESISVETRGKAGRTALRKAANVIRDQARANAARLDDPATKESIADNIFASFSTKQFRRTGDLMMRVGVRGGAKSKAQNEGNPGGDTFYWRFLEFGTARTAAKPFLWPAALLSANRSLETFAKEFNKSLDRFAKRGIT